MWTVRYQVVSSKSIVDGRSREKEGKEEGEEEGEKYLARAALPRFPRAIRCPGNYFSSRGEKEQEERQLRRRAVIATATTTVKTSDCSDDDEEKQQQQGGEEQGWRTLLMSMPMQQKFFVPLLDVPLQLFQLKFAAQGRSAPKVQRTGTLGTLLYHMSVCLDAYFDNESAEVISSLSLGDDQDSSQITNSNLFASENDRGVTDCSNDSLASSSPKSSVTSPHLDEPDKVVIGENKDPSDRKTSLQVTDPGATSGESEATISENGPVDEPREDTSNSIESKGDRPLGWIEWRETSRSDMPGVEPTADVPNGQLRMDKDMDEAAVDADEHWPSSVDADGQGREIGLLPGSTNIPAAKLPESSKGNPCEDLPEPLAFSTVENTGK
ncbi:hypothetical protein GW17_00045516 [Ensete ventricosum]|nr:hypothetical protein GW17_00045516 [Ensete ventricosum]